MSRARSHWLLTAMLCTSTLLAACGGSGGDEGEAPPTEPRTGTWLSGDLHLHSDHSDDATDNPMAEIVAVAEQRGMGYFVVTDHDNHVEGELTTWDDPAYHSDSMIMLYGVEWTTGKGHGNFFAPQRFDHPALYALREGEGAAVAAETAKQGVHLSVNHPVNGDPWEYGYDMRIDSIEVWNALFQFPQDNYNAIRVWDELLATGRRITARGGSDCHHQTGIEALGLNVGNPTTWVYAAENTGEAVVDALTAGRATIGYAPTAERIELKADADGDGVYEAMMGDNLRASGKPLNLRIEIAGFRPLLAGYGVKVIKNGAVLLSYDGLAVQQTMDFQDTPAAGERSYYRVEVTGSTPEAPLPAVLLGFYGSFVGLTNPIYVGFP